MYIKLKHCVCLYIYIYIDDSESNEIRGEKDNYHLLLFNKQFMSNWSQEKTYYNSSKKEINTHN